MQITKDGIERIRGANDLADVVRERGIALQRKGRQLVGSCPFHEEETASFIVSSTKGLFHCFGCGAAGDVIGFVRKHDEVSFAAALETLACRGGFDLGTLMEGRPKIDEQTQAGSEHRSASSSPVATAALLPSVVEQYHATFCARPDAQDYLRQRGLTDHDVLRAFKVGYADGSLLKTIPKTGEVRDGLRALGVVTADGRELLGGCIVVPIPDPLTGEWTTLYGRGVKTPRHCYLTGPLRGVLNFQAARSSGEVILTESVLDALSFHQVGIHTAIPLYGTNGFTPDHLDLLKRERVRARDPGPRRGRGREEGLDDAAGEARGPGPCRARHAVPAQREGPERAARLVQRQRGRRLPPHARRGRAEAGAESRRST